MSLLEIKIRVSEGSVKDAESILNKLAASGRLVITGHGIGVSLEDVTVTFSLSKFFSVEDDVTSHELEIRCIMENLDRMLDGAYKCLSVVSNVVEAVVKRIREYYEKEAQGEGDAVL